MAIIEPDKQVMMCGEVVSARLKNHSVKIGELDIIIQDAANSVREWYGWDGNDKASPIKQFEACQLIVVTFQEFQTDTSDISAVIATVAKMLREYYGW